jgi:Viral nucleic acid binding
VLNFNLFLFPLSFKMDITLSKIKKRFPSLPQNDIMKIYRARCERLRMLMHKGIPADIRWIIEAKVRFAGESSNGFVSHMPGTGKSSFAKKRRAKRLKVCHKCARWTCNTNCKNIGMASINREDKIQFIKDGLSKESLDDILLTLETHPSGDVQRVILDLWHIFEKEHQRYSLWNLTLKDHVCQFIRKLDGKPIPDP